MMKLLRSLALAASFTLGGALAAVSAYGFAIFQPADSAPIGGPSSALGGLQSCSSSCNGTVLLGPVDTSGYQSVNIQVISIGVGGTFAPQESNDPVACSAATNWNNLVLLPDTAAVGSNFAQTGFTFTGSVTVTPHGRCFRLLVTGYTSGTISAEGVLRAQASGAVNLLGGAINAAQSVYPQIPQGQVTGGLPVTGNATGTTAAVVGTLAGAAGKTTYICGFDVEAIGGTAVVGPITVAGLLGSSMVFQGSSSAAGGSVAKQTFSPCVPASAQNTAITITTTADATATAVDVNSWGFQL